jgi:hypothetical protein
MCGAVAKPAYTCRMCGMTVCTDCFDVQAGLCIVCAKKFGPRKL